MKLLGWMHRKFRQNGGEPFTIGNPCNCLSSQPSLDEQQFYPKPNYSGRPSIKLQKDLFRKSFAAIEEGDFEYEPSEAASELFHGLLTIGTLGSDAVISEPETPTFAVSFENVTEKETEVTEKDMKLINEELEKVLGADAKDDSSGRTSHVSSITLGGNENASSVCPLQGYLFGSSIGMPETTTEVGKKDQRTSLGELFQRTKAEEKREEEKCVKKNVKRKMLRSSTADSVSADTKLNKILQMFHRKVHPETSATTTKNYSKHHKNSCKNSFPQDGGGHNHTVSDEHIVTIPKRSLTKIQRHKNNSDPPFAIGDSNGNRECWIKTDANYLVLEL